MKQIPFVKRLVAVGLYAILRCNHTLTLIFPPGLSLSTRSFPPLFELSTWKLLVNEHAKIPSPMFHSFLTFSFLFFLHLMLIEDSWCMFCLCSTVQTCQILKGVRRTVLAGIKGKVIRGIFSPIDQLNVFTCYSFVLFWKLLSHTFRDRITK